MLTRIPVSYLVCFKFVSGQTVYILPNPGALFSRNKNILFFRLRKAYKCINKLMYHCFLAHLGCKHK